jgi:hypothetical protein
LQEEKQILKENKVKEINHNLKEMSGSDFSQNVMENPLR